MGNGNYSSFFIRYFQVSSYSPIRYYIGCARTRERVSGVICKYEAMNTNGARSATCGISLQKRT